MWSSEDNDVEVLLVIWSWSVQGDKKKYFEELDENKILCKLINAREFFRHFLSLKWTDEQQKVKTYNF